MYSLIQEYSVLAFYFAPRGKKRLLFVGEQIRKRHLDFSDSLIGVVGEAGSGKSSLIKGMFPELELSNDDDGLNPQKIMQVRELFEDLPTEPTTLHLDMRFQMAFTQMYEVVNFVKNAIVVGHKIVVEHFDLLYPALGINADIMIGIGEEIIIARPSIFGPKPDYIRDIVHPSLKYRKMAHSVEDITIQILTTELNISEDLFYSSDVRRGFVLKFTEKIDIDFDKLADRINEVLAKNLTICYHDEGHIMIGKRIVKCDGPRIHVRNTKYVEDFELVRELIRENKTNTYCLVGLLGKKNESIENRNSLKFVVN